MTREAISEMIGIVGLPYAFDHFDEHDANRPSGPPFICFLYPDRDDMYADDVNYARITILVIELYTDNVDFTLEGTLETVLNAAGLPFSQDRKWISSENMYKTTYTTEVLLTDV